MNDSSWSRLDLEVGGGLITQETIGHFRDAENYGTAPPMEWLLKRLRMAIETLASGHALSIESIDGEIRKIADLDEFLSWIRATLPQAAKGLTDIDKSY